MQNKSLELNINPLVKELNKLPQEFNRSDLLKIIEKHEIACVSLRHAALDGKIKELKVPVTNYEYIERILTDGERVDGSSLFKGIVDPSNSDLYIVPEYKTAFVDPFDPKKLNIFCSYYNRDGEPAPFTPNNILRKASELLKQKTGLEFKALGELEFYVIHDTDPLFYPNELQKGYHQSTPFTKCEDFINEAFHYVSMISGCVKYCHSEVGFIPKVRSALSEINDKMAEQFEIEFSLAPVEMVGDYLTASKWIIRNVGYKHNKVVTFAPKLEVGMAGSGLHFHCALYKDGKNIMRDENGKLSKEAMRVIGGLGKYAPSLTAFGNTVTSSYARLVPHQEAPTKICWSDSNRSALIRVPLGWVGVNNLASKVNPQQKDKLTEQSGRQTVELRSPDGSAHIHLLLAGMTLAALDGLTDEASEKRADELHVTGNIHDNKELLSKLQDLPASCSESAEILVRDRKLYENHDVVSPKIIDYFYNLLKSEKDDDFQKLLKGYQPSDVGTNGNEVRRIMHKDLHRH